MVTGTTPQPLVRFTVNVLPEVNKAIMFGGVVLDDTGLHRTNDVYLITYSENLVVSFWSNHSNHIHSAHRYGGTKSTLEGLFQKIACEACHEITN